MAKSKYKKKKSTKNDEPEKSRDLDTSEKTMTYKTSG